jgi:hypothetical protein
VVGNETFETVAKFKYLGMAVTNKNNAHEAIYIRGILATMY